MKAFQSSVYSATGIVWCP